MASAFINPPPLVVLRVVHHLQHINDPFAKVDPGDQAKAVIANVKDDAVAHAIGRTESLLDGRKVGPIGVLGRFVPGGQVALDRVGVVLSRFPEFPKPPLGNDAHDSPIRRAIEPVVILIANCDKSRATSAGPNQGPLLQIPSSRTLGRPKKSTLHAKKPPGRRRSMPRIDGWLRAFRERVLTTAVSRVVSSTGRAPGQ